MDTDTVFSPEKRTCECRYTLGSQLCKIWRDFVLTGLARESVLDPPLSTDFEHKNVRGPCRLVRGVFRGHAGIVFHNNSTTR